LLTGDAESALLRTCYATHKTDSRDLPVSALASTSGGFFCAQLLR